ncbi:nad dependent epimerase dehydratase family [Trichoderma arundinaceum]|uniref:Nad dependent epimerase dehydratase family n=1 Tax=Trichoderma arundinaceum TaxID=490622 RepID=A0A395NFE9_TRIAR|nr:nad dependent epimerase dehydratase family [Trichoderma arundinaceum]
MGPKKVLVTGATGYIGGSVLTQLLNSTHPDIKSFSYTVLVRKPEHAEYYKAQGITPILFENLDQADLLKKAASENDIVINTASAFRPIGARALIEGLAERKKTTGETVWYIHTSGTSSVGNRPVSKIYTQEDAPFEFNDKTQDIHAYELKREEHEKYPQRTCDVAVVTAGEEFNVPTYILMSPTIYGTGSGAFNKRSIQLPFLTRRALKKGYAEYIGEGAGVWDHAHIDDTAKVYELLLEKLFAQADVPFGRRGIYFAGNGRHSWKQVSDGIAKAGFAAGVLKEAGARTIGLADLANDTPNGNEQYLELGFASRSVTNAELTREVLGWKPQKGEEDWERGFEEEVKAAMAA